MLGIQSAEDLVLATRISQAVNVSPVLDNCFFHALALYFLANQLPFPDDLFTRFGTETPEIAELKARFPRMDSLALFEDYVFAKHPDSNPFPDHLVEKTMVLGIFLRSWFTKHLAEHEANRKALFKVEESQAVRGVDENHITFISLINAYYEAKFADAWQEEARQEEVRQEEVRQEEVRQEVATQKNAARENGGMMVSFLEQVAHNPIYQANSDFFRALPEVFDEELCKVYWEGSGYARYCAYLNANVKISHSDVVAILKDELEIPYVIYSQDSSPITSHLPESANMPVFELALNVQAGHYYLLKSEQTEDLLEKYSLQHEVYLQEREEVLRARNYFVERAKQRSSTFLAATLPFTHSLRSPVDLLVQRVRELDKFILNPQEDIEPVVQVANRRGATSSVTLTRDSERSRKETARTPKVNTSASARKKRVGFSIEESTKDSVSKRSQPDREQSSQKRSTITQKPAEHASQGKKTAKPPLRSARQRELERRIGRLEISLKLLFAKTVKYRNKLKHPPEGLSEKDLVKYEKKYKDAIDAVTDMHTKISDALNCFKESPRLEKDYKVFSKASIDAVEGKNKLILKQHRDDSQFYANLAGFILGLGVFYGLFVLGNYIKNGGRCTLFQTDGEQLVDRVEDDIAAMALV
ncbi:hypothetical protein BN59_03331 [Legionella massiliensis]|uniref:Uncharacterized protein n=1 Tax=Legionella massiliensis TaxID=1034943 RepID=A0A078L1E6_9GAMM|nr:hypothetical protein [Legionella massiliensis]CDZ79016.1 hypothetical protein BN59_03331 [Legionella massiliensis]CEE14754.1 hypothetical protein BN1094_03331 [Legionella massiliensis]